MSTTHYQKFRCGLTYQDAAAMLWVDSENPDDWHQKSRGAVLALLAKMKRDIYIHTTGLDPETGEPVDVHTPSPGYPPEWDEVFSEPRIRADGRIAVRREICHRGHRFEVTYWVRSAAKTTTHPAGRVPVKKLITHRGRQFEVTYWKKAA